VLGDTLGLVLGETLGLLEGDTLGPWEGLTLGDILGLLLGLALGETLGLILGDTEGDTLGLLLGLILGETLGLLEGLTVGVFVGQFIKVHGTPAAPTITPLNASHKSTVNSKHMLLVGIQHGNTGTVGAGVGGGVGGTDIVVGSTGGGVGSTVGTAVGQFIEVQSIPIPWNTPPAATQSNCNTDGMHDPSKQHAPNCDGVGSSVGGTVIVGVGASVIGTCVGSTVGGTVLY